MRGFTTVAIVSVACASLILSGQRPAAAQDADNPQRGPVHRSLTVNGTAEVKRIPDRAEITLGVVTENKSSQVAVADNAKVAQAIAVAERRLEIADKDIQTVNYSVQPIYVNEPKTNKSTIVGYRVYNQVRIIVHNMAMVGDVADAATGAGANSVEGVSFGLSDPSGAEEDALELAVKNARRRAERVARAAGATIVGIYDINTVNTPRFAPMMMRAAVAGGADAASTPISPGENTISANVTVVYELSPVIKAADAGARGRVARVTRARRSHNG